MIVQAMGDALFFPAHKLSFVLESKIPDVVVNGALYAFQKRDVRASIFASPAARSIETKREIESIPPENYHSIMTNKNLLSYKIRNIDCRTHPIT